jgi:hypothetical protein
LLLGTGSKADRKHGGKGKCLSGSHKILSILKALPTNMRMVGAVPDKANTKRGMQVALPRDFYVRYGRPGRVKSVLTGLSGGDYYWDRTSQGVQTPKLLDSRHLQTNCRLSSFFRHAER